MKFVIFLLLFIFSFGLYLFSAPPGLVAYRDAGEMVTVSKTLGVAHPPGYPLYALLGKLATLIPLSNNAYRVNLISALSGALTVAMLFLCLMNLVDWGTALVTTLLFSGGYLFWYSSIVQEMYSLNLLFAILLIFVLLTRSPAHPLTRRLYLFSFLFGLGLGNRMDLLLAFPGFAYLWWKKKEGITLRSLLIALCFFLLGFSVYLYLPIRSSTAPLLDWNHPASLERLWATLSRKTHGGTLDLLSKGYQAGENFLPCIIFYLKRLLGEFFYIGLPLGIFGLYRLYRKNSSIAIGTFLSYLVSGPVFIYLSNLPPNPHALAILEAHFVLSFLFFAFWIGAGIYSFGKLGKFFVLPFVILNFVFHFPQAAKRSNFFVLDYSRNILSSALPNSTVILREDVQLFSLWNRQIVEGKRPDATVIAQGLAGSPWYQEQIRRWYPERNIFLTNVKEPETLNQFFVLNKKICFSGDCELPSENLLKFKLNPRGILLETSPQLSTVEEFRPEDFYFLRGIYRYGEHYDFFTPDLIEEYARGYERKGFSHLKSGNYGMAEKNFFYALAMQSELPQSYSALGYLYFASNRWAEAEKFYYYALDAYSELYRKANQYRSSPEVKEAIRSDIANTYNNLGVVYERFGREEDALETYEKALAWNPAHVDAQFNTAVVCWKKGEWEKVVSALESVLRINPNHQQARNYLFLAKEKLKR